MSKVTSNKKRNELEGMVVIITGGSSGIGKHLALALVPLKPKLVIVARRERKLMQTARLLKKQTIKVLPIVGDVRNPEDRKKISEFTLKAFGRIDVLVNNAGLGKVNLFIEQPEEEINELIDTNVLGLMKLTQIILPIMKEQRKGHIINLSSTLALFPPYSLAVYSATKSAVKTFSDCIREEVKDYGISISTVFPGPYDTEFNEVAGMGRSSFKGFDVRKLASRIAKLVEKPKGELIQPWIFVPLVWLARRFPFIHRKTAKWIASSIWKGKKQTEKELAIEKELEKKEKIKIIAN